MATPYETRGMNATIAEAVRAALVADDYARLCQIAGRACVLSLIRDAKAFPG